MGHNIENCEHIEESEYMYEYNIPFIHFMTNNFLT